MWAFSFFCFAFSPFHNGFPAMLGGPFGSILFLRRNISKTNVTGNALFCWQF
jgi:hypothetical protein